MVDARKEQKAVGKGRGARETPGPALRFPQPRPRLKRVLLCFAYKTARLIERIFYLYSGQKFMK